MRNTNDLRLPRTLERPLLPPRSTCMCSRACDHVGALVHGGDWLRHNDANRHVVTRDSVPVISPAVSDTGGAASIS